MTVPLTDLTALLERLGVTSPSPEADRVEALLGAVSDEVRGLARRAFEGTPTLYTAVLEPIDGIVTLPHVPVTDVLSVRPVAWDGGELLDLWEPNLVSGGASTTLAAAAAVGDANLKVTAVDDLAVGDHLRAGSGATREVVRVTTVGTAGAGGSGVDVEPVLRYAKDAGTALVAVAGSAAWRLVSAPRGRLQLAYSRRLVEVVWRVSGEIPSYVDEATAEWVETRWTTTPARRAGLSAYKTGDDSETYSETLEPGAVLPAVLRMLGLASHREGAVI